MWTIAAALALIPVAPSAATDTPPLPPMLAPYVTDGIVAPGDYAWLRGRFPGATAQQFATFVAAAKFDEACAARSRTDMVARLKALGQRFDPGHARYIRPMLCRQFAQLPVPADVDWPTFSAPLAKVRPYALGILRATALAEQQVLDHGSYAEQLRTRALGEQTLRYAWIESQRRDGLTAPYTPLERMIHEAIILRALEDRDQANTAWLAGRVAKHGWPSRADVGPDASQAAWLLVQHADADPAFQLAALRRMQPLAASGAIDRRGLAMLTDRVQLKLAGRQRYGTQWTCDKGRRMPLPLEHDEPATDRLRKGAGLENLSTNAAQLETMYGPCPPAG